MYTDPEYVYRGKGKKSVVFTPQEEIQIAAHAVERVQIGCGLDINQLQYLMQALLIAAIEANPQRTSPWSQFPPDKPELQHLPTKRYVRSFLERHRLKPRRSMPLNKGRAVLTVTDLRNWQRDTALRLLVDPELAAAMADPARVFNQDETSLCPGTQHMKVIAPVGEKNVQNLGGDSRLHVTASVIVSADGEYCGVRLVYPGVRNRLSKVADIPRDGITGVWQVSVSPNGYVTRETFFEILQDLVSHLERNQVPRPVILFIDGFAGHLGPDIEY